VSTGVLLVQLGTPASPEVADVRRYLAEFLSDPRVLTMPAPARWLLLHGVILRVRPRRSAEAYRQVWTEAGSPLMVHSVALRDALAAELGAAFTVELAMRYGEPRLEDALDRLAAASVARLSVLPLFPHLAEATTGSALARVRELAARRPGLPELEVLGAFHDAPGFIEALAATTAEALASFEPDHLLLSYHGLPESQIRSADASGSTCLSSGCCDALGSENIGCYRAQCHATSRALAAALDMTPDRLSTAFQSRVGLNKWIEPYTDATLETLASRGVKRLAVACPSFVADCLETLEEIGLRGAERWRELGGEDFLLVPCVNAQPAFVTAVAGWLRAAGPAQASSDAAARTPEASASATATPSR